VDSVVEESKTYDMLVIGAGPEEGIKGTVLGGTQDQIAQRCPVPVLAVRKVRGPDVLAKAS
jgi:nucleotide-binding universal stress UspA family protein